MTSWCHNSISTGNKNILGRWFSRISRKTQVSTLGYQQGKIWITLLLQTRNVNTGLIIIVRVTVCANILFITSDEMRCPSSRSKVAPPAKATYAECHWQPSVCSRLRWYLYFLIPGSLRGKQTRTEELSVMCDPTLTGLTVWRPANKCSDIQGPLRGEIMRRILCPDPDTSW